MTRSEEELAVGTRSRESGRVRLRKYVVTENVTKTVPVQREEFASSASRSPTPTPAMRRTAQRSPTRSTRCASTTFATPSAPIVPRPGCRCGRSRSGWAIDAKTAQVYAGYAPSGHEAGLVERAFHGVRAGSGLRSDTPA